MLSGKSILKAIQCQKRYLEMTEAERNKPRGEFNGESLEMQPRIHISPFNNRQLNPNSYNLRLSSSLLVYDPEFTYHDERSTQLGFKRCLDMSRDNRVEELTIPDEGLVLEPGRLYLGATIEHTETYNLVPLLEGRSSVARLGLSVHLTAGVGESNFQGTWTTEMTVVHPLRVYAGVELCQILYSPLIGEGSDYAGKYQGQTGPRSSKLWQEFQPDR